ncbi:MAG: hypothetical protein EOO03_11915 [Chitinophagaceae bacterium]|nr:MAG: hypothetical protein EOO03_11915 [Chitinophagaceae bacterium]
MKRTFFLLTLVASLGFAACNSADKPEKDNSLPPAAGSTSAASTSFTADTAAPLPVSVNGTDQKITTQPAQVTATPATPAAAATAGLNPPHGQPGHKCEIAVGAPLNSAPATGATKPQIQTTATPAPVTIPAAGGNGTAKLNPPHGQPGHDCAVQVGAPLKN